MKRQEAISLIKDHLIDYICTEDKVLAITKATYILDELEQLGMLPPPHFIQNKDEPEYMKIRVHKWEDEDE